MYDNLVTSIDERLNEIGHSWFWLTDKIAARATHGALEAYEAIGTPRERQISYGLAIDLSNILGGRPEFWFTVQAAYDFLMDTTAGHYDPAEVDPEEDFDEDEDDDDDDDD